ncbi:MAG: flagellar basal body rod protein FlgC [Planctomycetota bacterium]|jgi:flagellar basal-body rod protein FlgC
MPIEKLFSPMQISASGLAANRRWMDVIAENLANAQTTRTDEGGPYRRKITSFQEVVSQAIAAKPSRERRIDIVTTQESHMKSEFDGRKISEIGTVEARVGEDDTDFQWIYDPTHPDANEDGYVAYPNVEMVREMVDLITASRAYEANITALSTAKAMNKKALEI